MKSDTISKWIVHLLPISLLGIPPRTLVVMWGVPLGDLHGATMPAAPHSQT